MKRSTLVLVALCSCTQPAFAQEICGLPGVGYNTMSKSGFEVMLSASKETPAAPASNTSPAPHAALDRSKPLALAPAIPAGVAPTITITDPVGDVTIVGKRLQIRGTVTGPVDTGVAINGIPAYVQGNQFVSQVLTLPAGVATVLTATATTLDGMTATASRSVTTSAVIGVKLTSAKLGEFTGRPMAFYLQIDRTLSVQQVTIDFNGDGTPEFTGTDPALAPAQFTYALPGVYTAQAQVTTMPPNSQTLTAKVAIAAIDFAEHRGRACSVYGTLRTRLAASDVAGAIKVFPMENRATYQAYFNSLGTNVPTFASRLGTIGTGIIALEYASLTLITDEGGQLGAYEVRIAQEGDGVWRIEDL